MKRFFDMVFATLGLVVLWPVLALLALGVKLTSQGPVFFRQERLGRDGVPFRICKFRSMTVQNVGPAVTAGGDARITPFGAFLRRNKLDELPQLWNVLKGDMSFVGPRPEVPEFAELYPREYARVLRVRPGITHTGTLLFRREEEILAAIDNPRRFYIDEILPAKIAAYERDLEAGLLADIRTILATIAPFMAESAYGPQDFLPALIEAPATLAEPDPIPAEVAAIMPLLVPTPLAREHGHAAARIAEFPVARTHATRVVNVPDVEADRPRVHAVREREETVRAGKRRMAVV